VFLATGICIAAGIRFDNPLNWIGPNLSSSQLIVPAQASPGIGESIPLSKAQIASLNGRVDTLAASLHASAVPLEFASTLYQVGLPAQLRARLEVPGRGFDDESSDPRGRLLPCLYTSRAADAPCSAWTSRMH
jgi:hypothetical protein